MAWHASPKWLGLVVLAALWLHWNAAFACTCIPSGDELDDLKSFEVVFSGTVMRQSNLLLRGDGPMWADLKKALGLKAQVRRGIYVAEFRVEESFKGQSSTLASIVTSAGTCGYPFQAGRRYVVFASKGIDGLTTGVCSATSKYEQRDQAFFSRLRRAAKGPSNPSLERP